MTFQIIKPSRIEIHPSINDIIDLCIKAKNDFDTSGELTLEKQEQIRLNAKDDRLTRSARIEGINARKGITLDFANLNTLEESILKNRDELEVINLLKADNFLHQKAKDGDSTISVELIKQVHKIIVNDSPRYDHDELTPGKFAEATRTFPGARMVTGANWEPVYWENIESYMEEVCRLYNQSLGKTHSIILACWLHHVITRIHPFFDGNGRLSRLMQDFTLMDADFIPVSIGEQTKAEYIDLLKEADNGDYGPLIRVMSENIYSQYRNSLNTIEAIEEEEEQRAKLVDIFRASKEKVKNKEFISWQQNVKLLSTSFRKNIDNWNNDFKKNDLSFNFTIIDNFNDWDKKKFEIAKGRILITNPRLFSIWLHVEKQPKYELLCYVAKHQMRSEQDYGDFTNELALYFSSKNLSDDTMVNNPIRIQRYNEQYDNQQTIGHKPIENDSILLREVFWQKDKIHRYRAVPSATAFKEINKITVDRNDEVWEFCSGTREGNLTTIEVANEHIQQLLTLFIPQV